MLVVDAKDRETRKCEVTSRRRKLQQQHQCDYLTSEASQLLMQAGCDRNYDDRVALDLWVVVIIRIACMHECKVNVEDRVNDSR